MVKSVIYVTTGPLFWSQRYEKFKNILPGNSQGWSWKGWVAASGKAGQGN